MEIVPNLHFNGNCEEAMALYERAFGAKRTVFLRYQEADPQDFDQSENEAFRDYVYHAELLIGSQRIMLTDHLEALPAGINVSLLVSFDHIDLLMKAYAALKDGAKILSPLTQTTYSTGFVSLVDKYGVRWELMIEN